MRSAVLLIAATSLFAQQEPTIRVDVSQVLVPVVVTDRKGHHVTGLRAADFKILEDGIPQDIVSFATDATAAVNNLNQAATPVRSEPASVGARRTYVICIDAFHSSPAAALRLRDALESLFGKEKTAKAPGDVQYVLVSIGSRLQVLQPATANPMLILQKVRAPAFQTLMGGMDSSAFTTQLATIKTQMEDYCRRCPCTAARPGSSGCSGQIDALKQTVDAEAARWIAPTKALMEQFRNVVDELAKVPTGRTLVLISDGFSVDPLREFYAAVSAYLPGAPQFHPPDSSEADRLFAAALQTAADRNITIDAVDLRSGRAPNLASLGGMDAGSSGGAGAIQSVTGIGGPTRTAPSVRQTSLTAGQARQVGSLESADSIAMQQLAHETGGIYFHEGENILKGLRNALADGREFYVLGYVSKNAVSDGKFRRITVETTAKNVEVRTKTGYWATVSAQ